MKPDNDHLAKSIKDEQLSVVMKPLVTPTIPEFAFDKNAVLYLVYLLYRTNILARNNLKNILDEVQKPVPANLTEWLVKESMK